MSGIGRTAGLIAAALAVGAAEPALCDDAPLRDLCADRPGSGTPTCTVDKGHLQLEIGLFDQQVGTGGAARTQTDSLGSAELRLGLTDSLEANLQWAPWTRVSARDKTTGARDRTSGAGDLTIAFRQHTDLGQGASLALQPFVTAPTGRSGIGGGRWQGGLIIPFAAELGDGFGLGLTGEADVVPDADSNGYHFAWAGVAGLSRGFGPVTLGAELALSYDDHDSPAAVQAAANLAVSYIPRTRSSVQFDAGANFGLNRKTPDREVYLGVAKRF